MQRLDFDLSELILLQEALTRLEFERIYPSAVTRLMLKITNALGDENGMSKLCRGAAAEGARSRQRKARK